MGMSENQKRGIGDSGELPDVFYHQYSPPASRIHLVKSQYSGKSLPMEISEREI